MSANFIECALSASAMHKLATHLQRVDEEHRKLLARDMHDELGGLLACIKMDFTWLRHRLQVEDAARDIRWLRMMDALDRSIAFTRRVTDSLRPSLLDNLGLIAALHWWAEHACRGASIHLREEYVGNVDSLTEEINISLFRVAQEAIDNLVRHSAADEMHLKVSRDSACLMLAIGDNGKGIGTEQINSADSHGLSGMRHRMAVIGGTLAIETFPTGTRTLITARLPAVRAALHD